MTRVLSVIVTRLYTGIKIFALHSYRYITNKAVCASSKHDDQDDKLNEHIGIRQFFTRQNFTVLFCSCIPRY